MAQNKKDSFSEPDRQIAGLAKAVAHPARVAILRELAANSTCICGEIVEVLPLAQSTVSQHLRELQSAGLVKGSIDGPKSCYCIDMERFEEMKSLLGSFLNDINELNRNNQCC